MTTIDSLDCSRFLIDPTSEPREFHARFVQYEEFREKISIDKISAIRYIILMYDIGNEEVQALFPDYMTRKRSCAVMAGFEIEKGRFDGVVETALIGGDEMFNKMIIRYVRMFNNPDYVSYVSYWEMLIKNVEMSISSTDAKDLQNIRTNIVGLRQQISEVTKSIFRGDETASLSRQLYATMEEEKLKLRPEFMAQDIFEGTLVFTPEVDVHKTIK